MLSMYDDGGGGGYGGVPVYLFADSEEPRTPPPEPASSAARPTPAVEPAQPAERCSQGGSLVIEVTVPQLLAFAGFALLLAWVLALQAKVAHLARMLEGARK